MIFGKVNRYEPIGSRLSFGPRSSNFSCLQPWREKRLHMPDTFDSIWQTTGSGEYWPENRRHLSGNEPEEYQFSADLAIEDIIVNAELSEEQSQNLQKAFEELSKRQREVLYLKYYQEVPYEEICEMMDISYQSVRNLVSNALRAMRKYMGSAIISFFFLKMVTKYL